MCVHGRNVDVIARGTAGGREPVGLFLAIDLVVHLLLNGTSLARDGAEDAHVRVPYPRAMCYSTSLTSSCSLAFIVDEFPRSPILSKLMGSTMRSTRHLALLRQTKISPVQASLGPKSMTALSRV